MLFGLFAVIESPAVFDVVVHGRKDLNRLCTSRQCIYRTLLSSLHRTVLSNSLFRHSKTYYLFNGNLLSLQSSIFFDSEQILIQEISISYSKNVVTDKMKNSFNHEKQIHHTSKMNTFLAIFFNTQKCVNKKQAKKVFHHTSREKKIIAKNRASLFR